jgi:phosphoribosylanthranilate isomerase
MKTRVKICGITNPGDALAATQAGADAVGLNFYAKSPRSITPAAAHEILRGLPPFVQPVALFVNETWSHIAECLARMPTVTTVQVHGDALEPCPLGVRWIPAFAVQDRASLKRVRAFVQRCEANPPAAVLVDAHVPGSYGGTGQTAPWDLLAGFDAGVPLILAGGLNPSNVGDAIRRVRPYAVDVASGVESSPGKKDSDKMRAFCQAAT